MNTLWNIAGQGIINYIVSAFVTDNIYENVRARSNLGKVAITFQITQHS